MMHIVLRKASSSPIAPGRALSAALASLETLLRRPQPLAAPSDAAAAAVEPAHFPATGGLLRRPQPWLGGSSARGFHASPGPLGFRASGASRAEFAVDDFAPYDEEKGSGGSDEGLEIAKLGIAPEIVSALAKKGITKLFPIQKAVLEPAMQGRDMIG